jgi:hypothetical protein
LRSYGTNRNKLIWKVIIKCSGGVISQRIFYDPLEAAQVLHLTCKKAYDYGCRVEIVPEIYWSNIKYCSACVLLVEPTIGKTQVIDIARSEQVFPPKVNRHLIDFRPIGINFPIELLRLSKTEAKMNLLRHLKEKHTKIKQRSWHEGRFYEEKTVLFSSKK